jgi:hypothetical protein
MTPHRAFKTLEINAGAEMDGSTAHSVRALRFVAIFAVLLSCGILIGIVLDKTDVSAIMPLSLLTAGLALNLVASVMAKRVNFRAFSGPSERADLRGPEWSESAQRPMITSSRSL